MSIICMYHTLWLNALTSQSIVDTSTVDSAICVAALIEYFIIGQLLHI